MIVLSVTSYNGAPVSIAPVSFDELGGTIGRATTNQLVLPDPDRTISRVHAHVIFKAGRYTLTDRGSNAVLHNGLPIGSGREVSLSGGDEIQIGGYLISASTGAPVSAKDPFSNFDLESDVFQSTGGNAPVGKASEFNLAGSGRLGAPPSAFTSSPPAKPGSMSLPDDWDPFKQDTPETGSFDSLDVSRSGALASSPLGVASHRAPRDGSMAAPRPAEESLDSLFGLSGSAEGKDPLAGSSFLASKTQLEIPDDQGILRALEKPAASPFKTAHDHDSDLNSPWLDVKPRAKPLPETSTPPAAQAVQGGVTASDALVRAFLEGLGVPNLRLRPVDAQSMLELGKLVRASTSGAVDLLAARTAMKKEVRAEVTVMSAVANNPLKFSPNVDFALQYLLGEQTPGFMAPVEAVQDAFHDLRAHQIGVMAGMRTALTNVLKRLDPSALEGKLAPQSGMASLIPSNRKAQLWDQFQALYGRLFNEAEDGFEELFVNAFVKEYERYVAQLDA
jgi:type VI secretion system FHA domain protein